MSRRILPLFMMPPNHVSKYKACQSLLLTKLVVFDGPNIDPSRKPVVRKEPPKLTPDSVPVYRLETDEERFLGRMESSV